MKTTIDAAGRIVIPKQLRDAVGLEPGAEVDVSLYGAGIQLIPGGRTARLVRKNGHLVATGEGILGDDDVFALIDAGRR